MPSVTMQDIADRAKVTKTTVSMVFRNRQGISEPTRKRVLDIAKQLGYKPAPHLQHRGRVHHGQIGVLFISGLEPRIGHELGGEYLFAMLEGARRRIEQSGSSMLWSGTTNDEIEAGNLPASLWRNNLDGLLVRGGRIPPAFEKWMEEQSFPCLLMDSSPILTPVTGHFNTPCTQINIDNIGAMEQVVDHLYSKGCRNFATITGNLDHTNASERLGGLKAALLKRGLMLDKDSIIIGDTFDEASGRRGAATFLNNKVEFDALVCQSDLIAYGAIRTLEHEGINIPDQVCITGMDNMSFVSTLPTPLTTIEPHAEEIGRLGAKLLLEQIQGEEENYQPLNIRVPTQLIARESTGGASTSSTESKEPNDINVGQVRRGASPILTCQL